VRAIQLLQIRMFLQQFFVGGGASGLACGAVHDRFGRLEKEEANDNAEALQDCGANLALDLRAIFEKFLLLYLGDDRKILRA